MTRLRRACIWAVWSGCPVLAAFSLTIATPSPKETTSKRHPSGVPPSTTPARRIV